MGQIKNIKLHIVTDIKRVICTKMFTVQSKLFVIGLLLLLVEDGENLCRDKLEEAPWVLQQFRVCFGAKDSNFGKFYVNQNGALYALKLVYHSGNVSCYVPDPTLLLIGVVSILMSPRWLVFLSPMNQIKLYSRNHSEILRIHSTKCLATTG